jgi:hypothetical protein
VQQEAAAIFDFVHPAIDLSPLLISRRPRSAATSHTYLLIENIDRLSAGKPVQQVDSNTNISGGLTHENWIDKLDAEELRARAAKLGIIATSQH